MSLFHINVNWPVLSSHQWHHKNQPPFCEMHPIFTQPLLSWETRPQQNRRYWTIWNPDWKVKTLKAISFWIQQCNLVWQNCINSLIKWVWFSTSSFRNVWASSAQRHSNVILWLTSATHSEGNLCLAEKTLWFICLRLKLFFCKPNKKLVNTNLSLKDHDCFTGKKILQIETGIPHNLLFKTNSSFRGSIP